MVPGQGSHRSEGSSDWRVQEEPALVAVLLGDFLFIYYSEGLFTIPSVFL